MPEASSRQAVSWLETFYTRRLAFLNMDLNRLASFALVAREGGYARAARAATYPITPSALHQQLDKLAAEVGAELLERVGKDGMRPTPAGERLLAFVTPFLRDLPTVVDEIRGGRFGGRLTIHAESLLIRHLLPEWLHRLRQVRPDADVHLQELPVASVEPLRRGIADVVVAHLDELPADIASETVAELHPCVVLPRDVVLRGGAPRRITPSALRSLADLTFLAYPAGSRHFDLQRQALARRGLLPRRVMHLDTADVILGFVASGLGWSLVPSLDPAGPSGPRLLALPLRRPRRTFPVQLAWRKDAPTHPLLDALIACAVPRPRRRRAD